MIAQTPRNASGEITLKARELFIKKIVSKKDGNSYPVVQIRGNVAFDTEFIQECMAQGVREIEDRDEEKDSDE